ncbi:uncharacterized protein BCR38DRAFT_423223 [Pseudomassariella vexata]|uniref:NADH dehydrogenase [ubiquinone] 1 alpha subcomplex assembly factor 3 n=1 Tax=Pseudomassariella vexata TaxID=1141098 RepID=A0A1Y2EA10_9PEZI|nr:uncharacterized protein BCR38DRAFT_423223 [Pseudomassariella vexata]ORY68428.1 hypothetical protein BCR38DRAFT_423223 [Pseudomassariella vexata]
MASIIRPSRLSSARSLTTILRCPATQQRSSFLTIPTATTIRKCRQQSTLPAAIRPFHASPPRCDSDEPSRPRTDFGAMDVMGDTPIPSSSVDACTPTGFHLNSGQKTYDGSGVLLVGGEAFRWRPWLAYSSSSNPKYRLVNSKGQWDLPPSSLGLLSLIWPRPDLLVLGLGPAIRPISKELRRSISDLGMRVEVLDTRHAAEQFNLLARERGVDEVAAALIPLGWVEGFGAGQGDEGELYA